RRPAYDAHAAGGEVVARLLLCRVEVAGRDELGAAALQREDQRDGLRLQVDARPDRQPGERPRPLELVTDRAQEARALHDPLDAAHRASVRAGYSPATSRRTKTTYATASGRKV